jgi:hypothetical protein
LDILIMTNFGRQASLNGRLFESLARAIEAKDPRDVQARISFDADAVTGEPRPDDLFHDEIEKLRTSNEFKAYSMRASKKPELSERGAEELIKGMGRIATVVVHSSGQVTANAIFATNLSPSERQRFQNEVDGLLQDVQRNYRIVKKKR